MESKGKYVYVANQGNNTIRELTRKAALPRTIFYHLALIPAEFHAGEPFGSGSGPQCIVEDPSDQFIYEANEYDSTVTGRVLDPNSGELNDMRVTSTYTLKGQPTWCLVDGRTN